MFSDGWRPGVLAARHVPLAEAGPVLCYVLVFLFFPPPSLLSPPEGALRVPVVPVTTNCYARVFLSLFAYRSQLLRCVCVDIANNNRRLSPSSLCASPIGREVDYTATEPDDRGSHRSAISVDAANEVSSLGTLHISELNFCFRFSSGNGDDKRLVLSFGYRCQTGRFKAVPRPAQLPVQLFSYIFAQESTAAGRSTIKERTDRSPTSNLVQSWFQVSYLPPPPLQIENIGPNIKLRKDNIRFAWRGSIRSVYLCRNF